LGLPTYVGHAFGPGDAAGSTTITTISPEYPSHVRELLLPIGLTALTTAQTAKTLITTGESGPSVL